MDPRRSDSAVEPAGGVRTFHIERIDAIYDEWPDTLILRFTTAAGAWEHTVSPRVSAKTDEQRYHDAVARASVELVQGFPGNEAVRRVAYLPPCQPTRADEFDVPPPPGVKGIPLPAGWRLRRLLLALARKHPISSLRERRSHKLPETAEMVRTTPLLLALYPNSEGGVTGEVAAVLTALDEAMRGCVLSGIEHVDKYLLSAARRGVIGEFLRDTTPFQATKRRQGETAEEQRARQRHELWMLGVDVDEEDRLDPWNAGKPRRIKWSDVHTASLDISGVPILPRRPGKHSVEDEEALKGSWADAREGETYGFASSPDDLLAEAMVDDTNPHAGVRIRPDLWPLLTPDEQRVLACLRENDLFSEWDGRAEQHAEVARQTGIAVSTVKRLWTAIRQKVKALPPPPPPKPAVSANTWGIEARQWLRMWSYGGLGQAYTAEHPDGVPWGLLDRRKPPKEGKITIMRKLPLNGRDGIGEPAVSAEPDPGKGWRGLRPWTGQYPPRRNPSCSRVINSCSCHGGERWCARTHRAPSGGANTFLFSSVSQS